jgi:phage tail tape-measure protein
MADSLTFTFSLDDKTSGPLKRMTDAMEKLAQGEEHVSEKAEQAHSWLERFAEIEVFKTAYEWAEKLADKVGEFGKEILSTADYSRTQKIALEGLLGSGEAAEKVFAGAKAFALEAGTPLKATVDAYRELTLAGVQAQNLPKVLQAASDLSIFKTGTTDAMGEFANILGRIQSRGQATSMEFRTLKGLLDFKTLSHNLGLADVMDATKEHAIPANQAIGAILKTLSQMEHGPLGKVTKAVGEGFGGALNKLKTSWDLLLERFESSGAFETVLHFLDKLQEQLGPTGQLGQWLGQQFEKVFKSIGTWLEELSQPGRFESIIASFQGIATSIGRIGEAVVKALPAIETVANASQFATSGHIFDFGERNKFSGKRYNAVDIARGMFGGDPSTEAEEGYGADPSLVTTRKSTQATGQGSAPTKAPITVNQTINVHATPGMDTDDLANHVSRVSVGDMTSAFESLGIASGGYGG